ncbi:hypothetical protein [Streptomyces sp. NPDC049879]|uniref:hypothetical protein n=1 Tax=Streptomyces sp. NPDC049879 TaxID=3365598 RepID=UPI00379ABCEA
MTLTPTTTRTTTAAFRADLTQLDAAARRRWYRAADALAADLGAGRPPRPGLRARRVRRAPGVWEVTLTPGRRATWQYGPRQAPGVRHVVWRRIGTARAVLRRP